MLVWRQLQHVDTKVIEIVLYFWLDFIYLQRGRVLGKNVIRSLFKNCLKKISLKWTQIADPALMHGEEKTNNVLFSFLFLCGFTAMTLLLWGTMSDSVNLGKSPDYHKSETFLLLQQKETMHLPHCLSRNFNCSFKMLKNLNVRQHINFFLLGFTYYI